jgi:LPS-assembly protein
MRRCGRFVIAFVLVVMPRAVTTAAEQVRGGDSDDQIVVDAAELEYDRKTDTIQARGNVVITHGATQLRADEVTVNRATNEAEARGNVTLTDPQAILTAAAVHLNLDEETGVLEDAHVQSACATYTLWGDRIEKGLGHSYHIENGRFTTCRCAEGPPTWTVAGDDIRVRVPGTGSARGCTFNVLDQPIAYIPRAWFPVERERQSGFLNPRFGFSNQRGFQMLLPFYWAPSQSQDLTVALDLETSQRIGGAAEYRYERSRDSHGTIGGTYFNDAFRGTPGEEPSGRPVPPDRKSLLSEHEERLSDRSLAFVDAFTVGDDRYLREINTYQFDRSVARGIALRTLPYTRSRAGFVQLWDRVALRGTTTFFQNLTGVENQTSNYTLTAPESATLNRLPDIGVTAQKALGRWLIGEFDGLASSLMRAHGTAGLRADIEPALAAPLPLGQSVFGAVRGSFRETGYFLTDTDQAFTPGAAPLPKDSSRELFRFDANVGSALDRVYVARWFGLEKIKHTIEPAVEYLYIPSVSQNDLPLWDSTDRVNHRNLVSYGFTTRLIGRFAEPVVSEDESDEDGEDVRDHTATPAVAGQIRELARLSVTQSYRMSGEVERLNPDESTKHLSDIGLLGRVNPSRFLSVRFRGDVDVGNKEFTSTRVGFFVVDPRRHDEGVTRRVDTQTSAGVSYQFLQQNLLQQVSGNAVWRITDWAGFIYASRYDIVNSRFLGSTYGLRFLSLCDCWSLDLALVDRRNPQEVEMRVQFTLAGLGSGPATRTRMATMP